MEARSASYYNTAQKSKDSIDTDYSSSKEITQQKRTDGLQDSNFRNLKKEKRKSVKKQGVWSTSLNFKLRFRFGRVKFEKTKNPKTCVKHSPIEFFEGCIKRAKVKRD